MNNSIEPEDLPVSTEASEPEMATYHYSAQAPRRPRRSLPNMPAFEARQASNVVIAFLLGALIVGFIATSSLPSITNFRRTVGLGNLAVDTTPIQQQLTVQETSAVISASKKVSPAVVSITASQQITSFFGQSSSQEVSSGSGFILTSDGLILTNKHVVSEDGATYKVVLDDGRVFDATIQATDPLNDLAVVKINATGLPIVSFGSSDALQIGQSVLAIGNALGEFQNSVTSGIVSAKGRSISPQSEDSDSSASSEQLTDLIQTDAAINPGNSGGPLINLDGQVVGIDTAIASTTGGSVGIGFAIPVDDFMAVISSVEKTGKISVPYLGVHYVPVDTTVKQVDNLSVDYGALISGDIQQNEPAVIPDSPAAKAGLIANDVILSVDGTKIDTTNTLQRLLQKHVGGDTVTLNVLRAGKQMQIKVTLASQS